MRDCLPGPGLSFGKNGSLFGTTANGGNGQDGDGSIPGPLTISPNGVLHGQAGLDGRNYIVTDRHALAHFDAAMAPTQLEPDKVGAVLGAPALDARLVVAVP